MGLSGTESILLKINNIIMRTELKEAFEWLYGLEKEERKVLIDKYTSILSDDYSKSTEYLIKMWKKETNQSTDIEIIRTIEEAVIKDIPELKHVINDVTTLRILALRFAKSESTRKYWYKIFNDENK